jgi:DNA-binding protein H-NS
MDVDGLLELRAEVERALNERAQDLHRQIALLGGAEIRRRGRPAGKPGRVSAMRGKSVPPKYRGPGGETWAGRGATPRWLAALLKEGHSIEEFAIGAGRKAKSLVTKKPGEERNLASRRLTHLGGDGKQRATSLPRPIRQRPLAEACGVAAPDRGGASAYQ